MGHFALQVNMSLGAPGTALTAQGMRKASASASALRESLAWQALKQVLQTLLLGWTCQRCLQERNYQPSGSVALNFAKKMGK